MRNGPSGLPEIVLNHNMRAIAIGKVSRVSVSASVQMRLNIAAARLSALGAKRAEMAIEHADRKATV